MRPLTINLLAAALLLFGATSANAYSIYFAEGGNSVPVTTSDSVTVNVFLDVGVGEQGVELFSVSVMGDNTIVAYNQGASTNPAYILYTPANGATLQTYLVPSQTPMQTWPVPPAGMVQVNVNWQETNLGTTSATGNNIAISTLVFTVISEPQSNSDLALTFSGGGNVFRANGNDQLAPTVNLGAPVTLVPEPALAGLGLAALATIAGLRRWHRSA